MSLRVCLPRTVKPAPRLPLSSTPDPLDEPKRHLDVIVARPFGLVEDCGRLLDKRLDGRGDVNCLLVESERRAHSLNDRVGNRGRRIGPGQSFHDDREFVTT